MADDQQLYIPGLAKATEFLYGLLSGNMAARLLAAANAPQLVAETQGTLTDAAVVTITEAVRLSQSYSYLVVSFDETAGKGRYSMNNKQTAAGAGFPIRSGGGDLTVYGSRNIANFKMIAETGQTLPYTYGLFI